MSWDFSERQAIHLKNWFLNHSFVFVIILLGRVLLKALKIGDKIKVWFNFLVYPRKMSSPQLAPQPSSSGKTSSAIVFLIVIIAIVFIFCGLLHLLVRFILKNKPSFLSSQSNQYPEMSDSDTFQRQLHQLFELHDSGLDQALIDALPVFHYKEINGLKEQFDCAVCLCEFSEVDMLRLVPQCSHAFHVDCIDTWLLSNSTCPLCRGVLCPPNPELEGPIVEVETFPVRLGKFRSTDNERCDVGTSSSSSNLSARRCYSMGSYQYVVDDSVLQVALSSKTSANGGDSEVFRGRFSIDGDVEGKRISVASKNESLSVSKIWLWSKKGKFLGDTSSVDMALPWTTIV